MPASTAQVAPAQEAGLAQPQTTTQPPGGPFVRYANGGNFRQYTAAPTFGSVITNPLTAIPGYLRAFRVNVKATGGSGTSVAGAADAPWNFVQNVTVWDAFGTVLFNMGGFEYKLWQKYSGGAYLGTYNDPASLGSYTAIGSTSGNFTFSMKIPVEFAKAYGTISMANAALLPKIQWTTNPTSTVYTTAPATTVPTVALRVDSEMYWLPQSQIDPPGLGSTRQAVLQVAYPPIPSGSSQLVTFPRLGGYIDTIILILRDSTNARIDAWPTRMRFWVDGVPMIDIDVADLEDDMANAFQYNPYTSGTQRETGVLVLTRKTPLGQQVLGLFDTLETTLSTNPGTLLQIEGSPWGTITNSPASLNMVVGQIVPSGRLVQGLPEM